jgi:hypothetical protein
MAATVTNTFQGQNRSVWTIAWGLDADATASITHGLAGTPTTVAITPTASGAAAAAPMLAATTISGTTVVITKATAAGTAAAGPCIVDIQLPHNITT